MMEADVERLGGRVRFRKALLGFVTDPGLLQEAAAQRGVLTADQFPASAQWTRFPATVVQPIDLFLSSASGVSHPHIHYSSGVGGKLCLDAALTHSAPCTESSAGSYLRRNQLDLSQL